MNNMTNKIVALGHGVVLVCVLALGALTAKMYVANYVDIAPNHPNSPYSALFPGRDYMGPVGVTDWEQFFADHFIFVTAGEEGVAYQLFAISRNGCRSFTGVNIDAGKSIDVTPYLNKAVLVRDFDVSEDGEGIVVRALDEDAFVNAHFVEYQQACVFPFSRLSEYFLIGA